MPDKKQVHIHEHQGKDIFREYGVPVPDGETCFSAAEAQAAAQRLGGELWVVKAQIHAGGRGKGGGVKLVRSPAEAGTTAGQMIGMRLITPQTGAQGREVRRILVEKGASISAELYLSLVVDRTAQKVVAIASSRGGVDIEEVAANEPEEIHKLWIEPGQGVDVAAALAMAGKIGLGAGLNGLFADLLGKLHDCFMERDASLIEINPLIVTNDGRLIALDAKMDFDDNALYRHPEIEQLRDQDEEDPIEREAAQHGLSYISLNGDIGCMVNGAGLAMATMDIIKLCGGEPANFLDVGGGASKEMVGEAFKLMLANPGINSILVNIFGGIMHCDVIAEGVVGAAADMSLSVPLVVRLEGTNVERGRAILSASGLTITAAADMEDAARKAVDAAARRL